MWYCYCKTCRPQEDKDNATDEETVSTNQEVSEERYMDHDRVEDVSEEIDEAQSNGEGSGELSEVEGRVPEDYGSTIEGAE